jgi:hypothetical protein
MKKNKLKIGYWNSNSGKLQYLGNAKTANEAGAVISNKLSKLENYLTKGILYFCPNKDTIIPYQGTASELFPFVEKIFDLYM